MKKANELAQKSCTAAAHVASCSPNQRAVSYFGVYIMLERLSISLMTT